MRSKIIILGLGFLLMSCLAQDNQQFKGCHFGDNTEICLILPEVGCGDCIAGGLRFLFENQEAFNNNQNRNKVIFTAISSKKMLYRALSDIDICNLYCEIDTLNQFLLPSPDGFYPIVVYLTKGQIHKIDIQNPYNDVLPLLKTKLYEK